jgi:aspartate carbamoyltransferase
MASPPATTTPECSLPTLTEDPASWTGSSLLSVTQITPSGLKLFFQVAQEMRTLVREKGGDNRLQHRILCTVFYEASTRTSCSFQAAMLRLGGSNIHVDGKGNSSAGKKGETLEDTIKCLECYADVTVLRHPEQGSVGRVIDTAKKPILNAGDGIGEHPSQALLDVFTISDELELQEQSPALSLTVVLLGDLKHGRTVHSLAKLLAHSEIGGKKLTLRYCAPDGLEMPEAVRDFCAKYSNVQQETFTDPQEACQGAHVLYVTRIQRERFESDEAYGKVKGCYVVDENFMKEAPSKMIVLHPLPRVDEISTSVDSDPRAAYFRQMENGMFVRMALLSLVLGKR